MTSTDASAEAQPSRSSPATAGARRAVPFDLKGTMAPLTVLRLRSLDLPIVERHLRIKIAQLPQLFLNAPVLIDVGALAGQGAGLPFNELVKSLRSCKLVPVAVANLADELRDEAVAAGLGIMQPAPVRPRADDRAGGMPSAPGDPNDATLTPAPLSAQAQGPAQHQAQAPASGISPPRPTAAGHTGPMVISQPVRSGQVVYAQNADLVVLAPVNPGAQVIADGHIHIYAPLRGRAVAGVQGLLGARIFCQRLEAELVAISGAYLTADDIPEARRGRPAQIHLEGGECRIAAL
jgi:septum site-determining protein MinC